jgi:hypothetical protein
VRDAVLMLPNVEVREVTMIIDPDSMYSLERPHKIDAFQVMSAAEKSENEPKCLFAKGFTWKRFSVPELVKIMHRSQFADWSVKVSAASRRTQDPQVERKSWFSGRCLLKSLLKHVFQGMGLTPAARACIHHVTAWDPELAIACMELNASVNQAMPVCTYLGTGWGEKQVMICKNILMSMMDTLSYKIDNGQYPLTNYDSTALAPTGNTARPELAEANFHLTRVRHASGELAILETEMEKRRVAYAGDVNLRKLFDDAVVKFNKDNNPSGVPWKLKRAAPEDSPLAVAASKATAVQLPPCEISVDDAKKDAYVFTLPESRRQGESGKVLYELIMSKDGDKMYLLALSDGTLYEQLARFMGTFSSGQPATTLMGGGSQWIQWKCNSLDMKVVARKKDTSMIGPDSAPAYPLQPEPLKMFIGHLEQIGKARFSMVTHKLARDSDGKVTGVSVDDTVVLPLPTSAPKKKALDMENVSGYIDIELMKKSKVVNIVWNLVCPSCSSVLNPNMTLVGSCVALLYVLEWALCGTCW